MKALRLITTLALLVTLIFLSATLAEANNATAVYRSNTGTNTLSSPKIRVWDSTGAGRWGSEVELASAGSPIEYALIRFSPLNSKRVIVTESIDGFLDGYVSYNNTDWTLTNNIGQVFGSNAAKNERRYDFQFETATGNVVLVYATTNSSGNCDLAYKVLLANDTNWANSGEYCIDNDQRTQNDQFSWINMDRNPISTSSELIMNAFNTNLSDITARVWGGSSWGNRVNVTSIATACASGQCLDVAYAKDGSIAMALGADGTSGNVSAKYWNGTSWTTTNGFDIDTSDALDLKWINLKSDSLSDDLQAVFVDSGSDLGTAYWNGTAWTVTSNIDAAVDSNAARPADFAWNSSTSSGSLVWDTDTTGTTLSNSSCTPTCLAKTKTFSTYAGTGAWLTLYRVPSDALAKAGILGLRLNSNFDIGSFAQGLNGSYYNYGDSALTADTTVTTWEAYNLGFQLADGGYTPIVTVYPLNQSASITLDNQTTDWENLTKLADTTGDNTGGASFDIIQLSLANGPSRLFAYINLSGGINLSAKNYYRIFIGSNESSGSQTTPDSSAQLPFGYTRILQLNNSKCTILNTAGTKVGNCHYTNTSNEIEIEAPLAVLNVSRGEKINATFETGNWTDRYDLSPNYPNYIEYGVNRTRFDIINLTNNSYENYTNDFVYPGNESFSVELWMKTSKAQDQIFISTGEYENLQSWWKLGMQVGENTSLYFRAQDGVDDGTWWTIPDPNQHAGQIYGQKPLDDNQWHHIVAIRDREQKVISGYVDGSLDLNFTDTTQTITDTSDHFILGASTLQFRENFDGNLTIVDLYNRALDPDEILDHYQYQLLVIGGDS